MAFYDFECECGYKVEIRCLMADRNKSRLCPECHKILVRLISNIGGFIFKGTGFYTTDVLHKKTHRKQAIKEKNKRLKG